MSKVSISVSEDLKQKINAIAVKSGKSFDECIALALRDYVDNYEDVYKTDLCSVSQLERSFFLSIGE